MSIEVPDAIGQALLVPEPERRARLLVELACALYQRGMLGFGLAADLADLSQHRFGIALTERGVARHYTDADVAEDFAYARSK